LLKADDRLAKGSEALQFAADHGDAYLRARALYHLGFLRACAGQFDEADELLMRAVQLGGERGTIGDMVGKFRSELQNMKQAMTRRQLDGQP
jgi:Tfp pilus assembly protein PilF